MLEARLIGSRSGVLEVIVNACIGRLACWVRLCAEVIKTEFPMHSLFSAFSVFRLPDGREDLPAELSESVVRRLSRFATFFKLISDDLQQQFADAYQLAAVAKQGLVKPCNFEAWRLAVESMQRRKCSVKALLPPLEAWIGWSCSTSGVEQDLATLRSIKENLSHNVFEGIINDAMVVATGQATANEDSEDIIEAQRLWAEYFGIRRAPHARMPRIGSCKAKHEEGTEKRWLALRRKEVDRATAAWLAGGGQRGAKQRTLEATAGAWTPKMDKECQFQAKKSFKHLVRGQRQGHTLLDDIGNVVEYDEKLLAFEKEERKCEIRREVDHQQRRLALQIGRRPPFQDLVGKTCFVADINDASVRVKCKGELVKLGASCCHNRVEADIFVIAAFDKIPQRSRWFAVLGGKSIADVDYLASRGKQGGYLHYKPATMKLKRIWVSPDFAVKHLVLHEIVSHFVQSPSTRWSWFEGSLQEYVDASKKSIKNGVPMTALVTLADKSNNEARLQAV